MNVLSSLSKRLTGSFAVTALVIWAIGSLWALLTHQEAMVQRFGALGVAAAILFFTDRLLKIELNRQRSVEKLLHEYGLELEAMKSGTPAVDIPGRGYVIDFLTEERKFDQLRARADRFNAANIVLLTLATLQWGFGDLFLLSIWSDGGT